MSAARADRLLPLLVERELDAMLVTSLLNVRYLTGYTGTNGIAVVGPGVRLFVTDFRYVEQAREEVPDYERVRGERDLLGDVAERLSGRVGFEDHTMSVRTHARLGELAGDGVELVPAGGVVESLRAVKDEQELAAIRAAAAVTNEVYALLPDRGLAGRTERDVAIDLEEEMRARGAEPAFPTIVAAGPNGAHPHAAPRDIAIEEGTLVVVDMGAQLDGYCSDCTRTFATGPLDDEAESVYELVLRAQQASLEAVRAGAVGSEVDAVARGLIEAAGHGERFGHGLGHGVGLEVHEDPTLRRVGDDRLEAGNVVTVEPGVYLPERFGVRIEDLVVVTDGDPEVLSGFPKPLTTIS